MFSATVDAYFRSVVKEGNFRLLSQTRTDCRIVYSCIREAEGELRTFDGYGLFVPLKGEKQYRAGTESYVIKPGEVLLLNYNQPCTLRVRSAVETQSVNFRLHKRLVWQTAAALLKTPEALLDDPGGEAPGFRNFQHGVYSLGEGDLGRHLQSLLDADSLDALATGSDELYFSLAEKLVAWHCGVQRQLQALPARKASTRNELFRRLHRVKRMIAEYPCEAWCTASLAKEAALSEAHFLRSFKALFGLSPHQFLVQNRLALAARELREGPRAVVDVAYGLGYSDLTVFSRAFKKQYGLAPIHYRAAVSSNRRHVPASHG